MFLAAPDGTRLELAAESRLGSGSGAAQRAENQDNFVIIDGRGSATCLVGGQLQTRQLARWPAGHLRLAVLDGMGGHGHGREAAEAVAAGLLALPACFDLTQLTAHLEQLHHRLQLHFDGAREAGPRPGTTLSMLEIPAHGAALLWHVGDSRLYEITAAGAQPLTVDHVPATVQAIGGALDEAAWWRQVHGSHAPQIAQAFILGNTIADPRRLDDALLALDAARLPPWLRAWPDRRTLALRADATYLLATDGFWSSSDPAEFVARWPRLCAGAGAGACVAALFDEIGARPPVGLQADNLTAIVFKLRAPGMDETALPGRA